VSSSMQIGSTRIRTRALMAWLLFKKGPLTSTGCDHGAFINTLSACTMHAVLTCHLTMPPALRVYDIVDETCAPVLLPVRGALSLLTKLAAVYSAGGKQPDLQVRFVPAASLDPDGVGSYVLFGQLAKLGLKYPSGFTFQVNNSAHHRRPPLNLLQPTFILGRSTANTYSAAVLSGSLLAHTLFEHEKTRLSWMLAVQHLLACSKAA
jgi:hypothetical protein